MDSWSVQIDCDSGAICSASDEVLVFSLVLPPINPVNVCAPYAVPAGDVIASCTLACEDYDQLPCALVTQAMAIDIYNCLVSQVPGTIRVVYEAPSSLLIEGCMMFKIHLSGSAIEGPGYFLPRPCPVTNIFNGITGDERDPRVAGISFSIGGCEPDVNGDSVVDMDDLNTVIAYLEQDPNTYAGPGPGPDTNGDGAVDIDDIFCVAQFMSPPMLLPDTDSDLVIDLAEPALCAAPGSSHVYLPDTDGDGILDGIEDSNRNGRWDAGLETLTTNRDTDLDGWEDGVEAGIVQTGSMDPNDPLEPAMDTDRDGLPASIDPDSHDPDLDGDRFLDGYEAVHNGLPASTNSTDKPSLGDVDDNQSHDNADAQLILMFFGNQDVSDRVQPGRMDLNRDTCIDNGDSQHSLNFFGHVIPYLPKN